MLRSRSPPRLRGYPSFLDISTRIAGLSGPDLAWLSRRQNSARTDAVEINRIHREVVITTIYVTHDQTEAMTMSDRVAVLQNGTLEQVASPLGIYNHPRSRFVGEFIGDTNFFEARVDPTRSGWINLVGIGPARIASGCRSLPVSGLVDLLVRPERLRLVGIGEAGNLNTLDMDVDTIVNYGDSVLAIGRVGDRPLRMRIAGTLPEALRESVRLRVGWAPADAHAVPRP